MKKYILLIVIMMVLNACSNDSWRAANRDSAGIALDPDINKEAVIEVYAADAYSWRGWFAVHTWIAVKAENAPEYTVYEVVGWRVKNGLPALREYKTSIPDRYWYGAKPEKLLSIHGDKANALIPKVTAAIGQYPWADEYTVFPGPNSNTFPAWVGIQVPELKLKMPFNAIGSGYAN